MVLQGTQYGSSTHETSARNEMYWTMGLLLIPACLLITVERLGDHFFAFSP